MSSKSVESGYSRLSDFTISCFRLLPRGPSPRRPFVLRSPPPSRAGAPLLERLLARGLLPPSPRRVDGEGVVASPLGTASPSLVSARCCARHARSEGFVVPLAAEIGFDDAKLELLGIAVVLPRPVYSPDAALVDPLPSKSFTVDFVRPNSCCSMAMVAPSAYLSAKRCLNSAE